MKKYNKVIYSCYIGSVTQACMVNFFPLLFVMFQQQYGISLEKISFLISFNFFLQLIVDAVAIKTVDKAGYKKSIIFAYICAACGMIGSAVFTVLFDFYAGLVLSVFFCAVGSGLIEVLLSPIVENCPSDKKDAAMSILHSFYCWGHIFVVIISTLFFKFIGINYWKILAVILGFMPLFNCIYLHNGDIIQPEYKPVKSDLKSLFKNKAFLTFILLMICAGAAEQSMSQWISAFAETGLNLDKNIGDIFGVCLFAFGMGISRAFYGKYSDKLNLKKYMLTSCGICIFTYITASMSSSILICIVSFLLCGISVGIMWPGTLSLSSKTIKNTGTVMFAVLALAGDIGCSVGPGFVGLVSQTFNSQLRIGILFACVFSLIMFITLYILNKKSVI